MTRIGTTVGRYLIEESIQQGPLFDSWAVSTLADVGVRPRRLTLRMVRLDQDRDARALRNEYDARQRIIDKRHVLDVYEYFEAAADGTRWACLVTEPTQGMSSVRELVAPAPAGSGQSRALDMDSAVDLFRQAAMGFRAIHNARLCHGDVRPEHILAREVDRQSWVLAVAGLGTASDAHAAADSEDALSPPTSFGLPQFAAPETWTDAAGPKADAYGLGFVFYELFCGRAAFEAQFASQIRASGDEGVEGGWRRWNTDSTLRARPLAEVNPACPSEVAHLIDGLMEKDAGRRLSFAQVIERLGKRIGTPQTAHSRRSSNAGGETSFAPIDEPGTAAPARGGDTAKRGGDGGLTIVHLDGSTLHGKIQVVMGSSALFGRMPACDVRFDAERDRLVSAEHLRARIRNGTVFVEDVRSANGTWVNGRRVEGEVELRPGDVVSLGQEGPRMKLSAHPHAERGTVPDGARNAGPEWTREDGLDDRPSVIRRDPRSSASASPTPKRALLIAALVAMVIAGVAAIVMFGDVGGDGSAKPSLVRSGTK